MSEQEINAITVAMTPSLGFYVGVIVLAIFAPRVAAFGFLVIAIIAVARVRGDPTTPPGIRRSGVTAATWRIVAGGDNRGTGPSVRRGRAPTPAQAQQQRLAGVRNDPFGLTARPAVIGRIVTATVALVCVLIVYDGWAALEPFDFVLVIVGPVVAICTTHVFSGSIVQLVTLGRRPTMQEWLVTVRFESRFLLLAVPPLLVLLVLHLAPRNAHRRALTRLALEIPTARQTPSSALTRPDSRLL